MSMEDDVQSRSGVGKYRDQICGKCLDQKNHTNRIQGHLMSLAEMNEKNIMACDILSMFQLPMQDYSYSGISPTIKESDFDSSQRMVYFIPGRETKYVKVSE